jgi:hypothetical protein
MHTTITLGSILVQFVAAVWFPRLFEPPATNARAVEFDDRFVMKDGSPYNEEFLARFAVDDGGNTIVFELPLFPSTEIGHFPPTKTKLGRNLNPRTSFTFTCPTSVQCNDGGCCMIGDYCAIRDGALGCCPIGSLCDASPIPGCSV